MATIVPPKLLLLDEHTAALDPATAQRVIEITNEVVQRHHLTTLMITHSIAAALKTGTRTIMLDAGKIILDMNAEQRSNVTPEDLIHRYNAKQ